MTPVAKVLLRSELTYFYAPIIVGCDANCAKAWGINNRPRVQLSANEDDYAFRADDELGTAPADPGTYEGDHAKPLQVPSRHNKWCVRECERSAMVDPHEPLTLPDFSQRVYNIGTGCRQAPQPEN